MNPLSFLGPHYGYLPQDIELFDGSVALNIARFSEKADPLAILEAVLDAPYARLTRGHPGTLP